MDRNAKVTPEPYVYQEWPAVRYGPDGQNEVFHNEDEVPEGWVDHPAKVGKGEPKKALATDGVADDDETVEELVHGKTQKQLVDIIDKMNNDRDDKDQIEYLAGWPKLRLAKTIVAYDGPPEEDEED